LCDLILRFLIGGLIVSAFAVISDVLKPKSFAGLFGAAPSIALATLGLTTGQRGSHYAAVECRSMLIGAISLGLYAWVVCRLIVRRRVEPLAATLRGLAVWFLAAFCLWIGFLR